MNDSKSRAEVYLKAAIDGTGVEGLPPPQSRLDELLLQLIKNGAGGGGASSWNDLTDKPFYNNAPSDIVIDGSWDDYKHNACIFQDAEGNTPDELSSGGFHRVTDAYITPEDAIGTIATLKQNDTSPSMQLTSEFISKDVVPEDCGYAIVFSGLVLGICVNSACTFDGSQIIGVEGLTVLFPAPGMYVLYASENAHISHIQFPFNGKKLDVRFCQHIEFTITGNNAVKCNVDYATAKKLLEANYFLCSVLDGRAQRGWLYYYTAHRCIYCGDSLIFAFTDIGGVEVQITFEATGAIELSTTITKPKNIPTF